LPEFFYSLIFIFSSITKSTKLIKLNIEIENNAAFFSTRFEHCAMPHPGSKKYS